MIFLRIMKTVHFLIFLFLLLFSVTKIHAQYVDSGQDPAKINWKQINTQHFQLIFPEEATTDGLKLAKSLELVYKEAGKSLNHHPKKISVILHSYTSVSNAAVYWAPRRTEFNTIPPQDIYPQYWLNQLAIHEFRHVVQLDKMRQGFTELLYLIFGEQATALVTGLHVPLWFLEGDAVVTETALSCSGRGKLPEFGMPLRALLLEKKIFTYEKAYFRSFKDFIPNHYVLGYYLVSHGREKYGYNLWSDALNSSARAPFIPYRFYKPIRKATGAGRWKFYRQSMQELQATWTAELDSLDVNEGRLVNDAEKKVFTSYRFPQALSNGNILAKKSGLSDIDKFIVIDTAGEQRLIYIPGFFNINRLSAEKNKLVWEQYNFDARWSNRIYSDIHLFDLKTEKHSRLTDKRYLFSPALSPDGNTIVAVEALPVNQYSLVFLNAQNGEQLLKIPHPENLFPSTPSWSKDGEKIVGIFLEKEGKTIEVLDIKSRVFERIFPPTCLDISQPVFWKEYIVFRGTFEGKDDIFALGLNDKKHYKITESKFGAFDPNIHGDSLIYSSYSSEGYNIRTMMLDTVTWTEIREGRYPLPRYSFMEREEDILPFDYDTIPDLPVQNYKRWKNLINIHSWFPAAINIETGTPSPGITFLSQNKLSTSFLTAGYKFNLNERTDSYSVDYTYKGWYPVWSVNYISRLRGLVVDDTLTTWKEDLAGLSVRLPLNLTEGKYATGFIPSASYQYIFRSLRSDSPENLITGPVNLFDYDVTLYRYLKMAPRDLLPRLGQDLTLNFRHSPFGRAIYQSVFFATGSLYLPGILKHHSFVFSAGYEKFSGRQDLRLPHLISFPRGYFLQAEEQLRSITAEYWLPLVYPDFTIRGLLYVKRIRATLFLDYAKGTSFNQDTEYTSTGVDLVSDLHLLNFFTPFDLGVRYIYLPAEKVSSFQLLFNIQIPGI